MHPRNHRSQSARPRGRNSAPWGVFPAETLLDPKAGPSRSENDGSVGSRKRTRSDEGLCSTPPCRASTRTKKMPRRYSFEEVATEFRGCLDPKNRGRRSVRPRGNKPAGTSWAMSLDGFLNLGTAASSKLRSGGSEQGNGAGANCTDEQIGVADSASIGTKDINHGGDNVAAELKVSNGTYANSVVQTIVPATDTLPDLKESNGPVANALAKTAIQANNDFDPLKDRANDAAEFDSKTISGLVLNNGNIQFDLSSAESALASLYGESDRDMCIEFAVKLLMNEIPLPKEAAEIEEFFSQNIHGEKSAKRQKQQEPNNVCSVWGSLQSDKLLLTSRC